MIGLVRCTTTPGLHSEMITARITDADGANLFVDEMAAGVVRFPELPGQEFVSVGVLTQHVRGDAVLVEFNQEAHNGARRAYVNGRDLVVRHPQSERYYHLQPCRACQGTGFNGVPVGAAGIGGADDHPGDAASRRRS